MTVAIGECLWCYVENRCIGKSGDGQMDLTELVLYYNVSDLVKEKVSFEPKC